MMDAASRRFTWLYAAAQLKLKYRYTSLGFLWNVLEPALYLGVLSVVFSVVNRMRTADYAVFLFSALVPWRYFEKVVSTCMDSIVQGDWLLRKLPVSPFALPLTRWMVATAEFGFSFLAAFVVFAFLRRTVTVHCLVLPLSVLPWALGGLGLGLACAALFTFFRDIRPIVSMGLMFAFFSAPILFKAELFEAHTLQATLLAWHPLTYMAALFQKPVYYGAWPSALDWAASWGTALASLAAGSALVWRWRDRFYFYL
jgi:ABC-type polysaccharide/polyol phosphate export permease